MVPLVSLIYSIEVTPSQALLGEPINALLRCTATSDTPGAVNFEHRSLVFSLSAAWLAESLTVFPNRHAIEAGGRLVRLAATGGIEDLTAGEERTRELSLLPLFPALLGVGVFAVSYRLEEAVPPVSPEPAVVETTSGPGVVPLLLSHLESESSALRFRANELLEQMTAQDFGFQSDGTVEDRARAVLRWSIWWQQTGALLPWNFQSEGATFAQVPDRAPVDLRSGHLGGIAYPGSRR